MKEEQKEKQERFLIGVNPYANEFFVFRGEGVTDEGLEDWIEETLEDCDDMKATVFDRSQAERAFYDLGLTLGLINPAIFDRPEGGYREEDADIIIDLDGGVATVNRVRNKMVVVLRDYDVEVYDEDEIKEGEEGLGCFYRSALYDKYGGEVFYDAKTKAYPCEPL